ncbi:response regulator [Flavihumibacter sp. RY-1]|uniref:Response regulator n=1 Tax=Flavihumibacter fluminis TaxID=2909236 RepID=A0ABS9BD78_9BACT|nr:response regulator [Flavihumibacter fluminis]MCF1713654.1 response regulator [Flavihumibacter fluminis]
MEPIRILLVEDNEGDVVLTLEAFESIRLANSVKVVNDGEEAIQYLNKEGSFADAEEPDMILLDINLPKIDGKQVLQYIKTHERFKVIPVVILTSSASERDINETYSQHANCYITKPVDFSKFITVIKSIETFWINIVQLPVKQN